MPANPDTAPKGFFSVDYPKRLIEVDLPIRRISAHATQEKKTRHGHISTLHIWWARRPLAACRAVICAALWPDPADDNCPAAFRDEARQLMTNWAKDHLELTSPESMSRFNRVKNDSSVLADNMELRKALLDFIADFADWDNSANDAFIALGQRMTAAAHEAFGHARGTKPVIVDPFAGGGAIPLEALRVGADCFSSDLNPVPYVLNKTVLEYMPRHASTLPAEVRRWGTWIKEKAEHELASFYPQDKSGGRPIAYLWARTVLSEAPDGSGTPIEVPLLRSLWLAKKGSRRVALRWARDSKGRVKTEKASVQCYRNGTFEVRDVRRPVLEIFEPASPSDVESGTVARGNATCPVTGYTTSATSVREQLKQRRGGAADARLLCVVTLRHGQQGRIYRLPTEADEQAVDAAHKELTRRSRLPTHSLIREHQAIPTEPTPLGGGRGAGRAFGQRAYGMTSFADLFTRRQMLALTTLTRLVCEAREHFASVPSELADAVQTCLALNLSKLADLATSLGAWEPNVQTVQHMYGRQAIPVCWDFAEGCPISESRGSWSTYLETMLTTLEAWCRPGPSGRAEQGSAHQHPLPDDSASAFITDPPYYDAVPYSDLADFFYVWLRRALPEALLGAFQDELTPKKDECIVDEVKGKDHAYFHHMMTLAMSEGRRVTLPDGLGIVVFAHKSTAGWEAQLAGMIDAGWVITGSWPIDTELETRLRGMNSAALASSVHLVCRPREQPDGTVRQDAVGDWRAVLNELPARIHEWMPRLAEEGVVGADAIFACLGPALEIFSRYSRVEKASGEVVTLREYLEQVWAAVSTEALSMIFRDADAAGLESDARFTAIVLWTLGAGGSSSSESSEGESEDAEEEDDEGESPKGKAAKGGYTLEYDAARKIAQGLGVNLEQIDSVAEVKGDKARLRPVSERAASLFGKAEKTEAATKKRGRKATQKKLFDKDAEEGGGTAATVAIGEGVAATPGATALDRVHQSMLLFAGGRADALKRFIVEDGVGGDARFWKLAQSLSALYPAGSDEKRWVDGVLARKKSFGF